MSVVHHEHDWLSDAYVHEWIESDATRDAERRPKLRRAASLLPFEREQSIKVLDLGGGYGEFAGQVLEVFPHSAVVLHDFSSPMIAAARERLAEFGERVDFRLSDLSQPGWSDGLGGPFDAVVSSIAIHNLRQPALIHDVYREVATVVAPGGAFLNLDYIFPGSPLLAGLYGRASGGGGRARATASAGHVEQATLENQLRWLLEGFDEVDCLWKELREVLLCGLRARS
jgi:ubiquinone/menaquinone biosynthesis C-methylase UbiE